MNKSKLIKGEDCIGVGGGVLILNNKKEVLLIRRSGKVRNESGWWSKPGGGIKFGETAGEAMKREMKEELGVEIKITGYFSHTDHFIKDKKQHWVAFNYLARIISGKPENKEPHKCSEIRWFKLDNLPNKITQTTQEPIDNYLTGKYIELEDN